MFLSPKPSIKNDMMKSEFCPLKLNSHITILWIFFSFFFDERFNFNAFMNLIIFSSSYLTETIIHLKSDFITIDKSWICRCLRILCFPFEHFCRVLNSFFYLQTHIFCEDVSIHEASLISVKSENSIAFTKMIEKQTV